MPDSGVEWGHGERVIFPQVPSGARGLFLARNPLNNLEELWMLCVDKNDASADLGSFWGNPNVQQLTYQEMAALGKQWNPNFVPPSPML